MNTTRWYYFWTALNLATMGLEAHWGFEAYTPGGRIFWGALAVFAGWNAATAWNRGTRHPVTRNQAIKIVAADDRACTSHCDPTILHAPGKCGYCDGYPDWQAYRELARIAFTGEANERGVKPGYDGERYDGGIAPCPSTWRRSPGESGPLGRKSDVAMMEGRIARRGELFAAAERTASESISHELACMQCRHGEEMCETGKALDAACETAIDAYENEVGDVVR